MSYNTKRSRAMPALIRSATPASRRIHKRALRKARRIEDAVAATMLSEEDTEWDLTVMEAQTWRRQEPREFILPAPPPQVSHGLRAFMLAHGLA